MKRAALIPIPPISLTEDQLFYLGAMALYASRPHSSHHDEKIAAMEHAVNDATLMWAVMRAQGRKSSQDDISDAPSPPWTP